MGQAATVDGPTSRSIAALGVPDGPGCRAHPISLDRVKSLSSNAPVTAARHHDASQGGRRLEDDYELTSTVIGSGACGQVLLARGRADRRRYALKTMPRSDSCSNRLQHLTSEVEIYLTVDHPNIARLHDVYETQDATCLLTHYCEGGELYSRLQRLGLFPEAQAAEAVSQMLRAVGYLHSHHIVHRDIKLENFVYESLDSFANLKLIDFGMAILWDQSTPMVMQCGSLMYVSPDVLCGEGYTDKCDLWSLGVITWMLLTGRPPFDGDDDEMLKRNIRAGELDWIRNGHWDGICTEAIDFVRQLLDKDSRCRPSAEQAAQHCWFAPLEAEKDAYLDAFSGDILRSLKSYAKSSALRRAFLQFLAHELAHEETRDLQKVFLALDQTNKGTVCLGELQEAIRGAEARSPRRSPSKAASGKEAMAGSARPKAGFAPASAAASRTVDVADACAGLCSKLDVNGDEQIYYLDFLAATIESLPSICEASLLAAFNRLDADGSGRISAENLEKALGGTFKGNDIEELLSSANLYGDVEITFKAFVHLLGLGHKVAMVVTRQPKCDTPPSRLVAPASNLMAELPKEAKKVCLSECSISNVGAGVIIEVLDWAIDMFAPANGPGGLGTSAVALFSGPGSAALPDDGGTAGLGTAAVTLFNNPPGATSPTTVALRSAPDQRQGTAGGADRGPLPQVEGVPWEADPLPKVRPQRSRTLLCGEAR